MQDKFSLRNRNFSYWERDVLEHKRDFIIIGGGLVGLSAGLSLREKYPTASILILDRSSIPYGASTRNAGFACFGSVSEILDDLNNMSAYEVEGLIRKRYKGLKILKERVGEAKLSYKNLGGYELFSSSQDEIYQECSDRLKEVNDLVNSATGLKDCFKFVDSPFNIKSYNKLIFNQYEGQLHPGKMMHQLECIARNKDIEIKYGVNVESYRSMGNQVSVSSMKGKLNFVCGKLLITTNAFVNSLVREIDVKPGRNQVMITKPINSLKLRGTFHYDRGYVYFRNIGDRLLIGGGRNISIETETTDNFGLTDPIKDYLRRLLSEIILPNTVYEEDTWWSGIIATGASKTPIVEEYSDNVFIGVRLSGMGVALGSLIGQELADML